MPTQPKSQQRVYAATYIVVFATVAALFGSLWLALKHSAPGAGRNFTPEWNCRFIGDAEFCERNPPPLKTMDAPPDRAASQPEASRP